MPKRKKSPPPQFATAKGSWDRTTYVMLFNDQLNSPAYIALSAHAKEAYTIIRQEYKGPEYTPDNVVKCTYPTFRSKGMRQNTVSRALDIDDLVDTLRFFPVCIHSPTDELVISVDPVLLGKKCRVVIR